MRLLSILFSSIICLKIGVFAELSPSSCSLLRTATSITTIVPEIAQLAMRYYRTLSPSIQDQHHRQKRFLFNENTVKSNRDISPKGSVLDQMVANSFKDVNFTKVALLILNNNESMTKIRQNINSDVIIRAAMHEIDYEKLGNRLWYAAEAEFDLEYVISSIINITHTDIIYEELIINGTLPEWVIKSIHPNLNVQKVNQMFETLTNMTNRFISIMNSTQHLDDYLFNTVREKVLIPLGNSIQKVKDEKPTTLDQLVEIILNNVNKIVVEQFTPKPKSMVPKKDEKKTSTTTTTMTTTLEENTFDDVNLLFYQSSITIDSIGQTIRSVLKALDQLYCASVWE